MVEPAWLVEVTATRHPIAHPVFDGVTIGGPDADIDLFGEEADQLAIAWHDGAWYARGAAWRIDGITLATEQPLWHGRTLSHAWSSRLRFLLGDRDAFVEEERYLQTIIDPMTGLLNRRFLFAHLHRLDGRTAILSGDLDHLKRICDRYGHVAGDDIIVRTADVLRDEVRWPDCVARFGGEEFIVLLRDSSIERARRRAERIRAACEPAIHLDGELVNATISIGIAMVGDRDPHVAIREAEDNLHAAKGQGRNRVVG